jgi:hypothetical protein
MAREDIESIDWATVVKSNGEFSSQYISKKMNTGDSETGNPEEHDDKELKSFADVLAGTDPELLKHLAERLVKGHSDSFKSDESCRLEKLSEHLGRKPSLEECEEMASEEKCYIGSSRWFDIGEGRAPVEIRILYIYVVLYIWLLVLAKYGAFREELADRQEVHVKYRCWTDGTTISKKQAFCMYVLFMFDSAIFKKKYKRFVMDPQPALLSMNTPETRSAYDLFYTILSLQNCDIKEMRFPVKVLSTSTIIICMHFNGILGDNHAQQPAIGADMSGALVCVFCYCPRSDWHDICRCISSRQRSLVTSVGDIYDGVVKSDHVPAMLLGQFRPEVLEEIGINENISHCDAALHEAVGMIKLVVKVWKGRMSGKDQKLMEEKAAEVLCKPTGTTQYMNGGDWKALLYVWELVVLPHIRNFRVEATYLWYYVATMYCNMTIDMDEESGIEHRDLSLSMFGCAMGLYLLTVHLNKLGVIEDSYLNLYWHHFVAHLATLFLDEDFRLSSCEQLEMQFKTQKYNVRNFTNFGTNLSRMVLLRMTFSKWRSLHYDRRGCNNNDRGLKRQDIFRSTHPVSQIRIPKFLLDNYPEESRILKSTFLGENTKYFFTEGNGSASDIYSDTSAGPNNGDLIFNVCEIPSPDFGILDGEVEGEKAPPAYKVCARPSNEEIQQAFVSGGYDSLMKLMTQVQIKRYFYDMNQMPMFNALEDTKKGTQVNCLLVLLRRLYGDAMENRGEEHARSLKLLQSSSSSSPELGPPPGTEKDHSHAVEKEKPTGTNTAVPFLFLLLLITFCNTSLSPKKNSGGNCDDEVCDERPEFASETYDKPEIPHAGILNVPTPSLQVLQFESLTEEAKSHLFISSSTRAHLNSAYAIVESIHGDLQSGFMCPRATLGTGELLSSEECRNSLFASGEEKGIPATLDSYVCLYEAAKALCPTTNQGNFKPMVLIVKFMLTRIPWILDLSTQSQATANGFSISRAQETSMTSRIYVPMIPADALEKVYVVNPCSTLGRVLLSIEGNDRAYNYFGNYHLWRDKFDEKFPNGHSQQQKFLNGFLDQEQTGLSQRREGGRARVASRRHLE